MPENNVVASPLLGMSGAEEVTFLGALGTGHGCWVPRPNDQGSNWFYIDGIPVHLQTHHWAVHCCPALPECHDSYLAAGSPLFYIDGLQVGRHNDPVACGSRVAEHYSWVHFD
ncbi:MAG: PAAR domain-containing protein [Synergistaceae bacterium]|jgi:uncharacterized Zn-binding protein involved in type VI secretion|nr:PAAR domain-containing protein [Synergistaceae bacterium]